MPERLAVTGLRQGWLTEEDTGNNGAEVVRL
jgi:hypothetical protein